RYLHISLWLAVMALSATTAQSAKLLYSQDEQNQVETVRLKMADPKGGPDQVMFMQVRTAIMKQLGFTKEEVETGYVVTNAAGIAVQVRVKGRSFPLNEKAAFDRITVFHMIPEEEPYVLDLDVVGNITVDHFR
ncbi:unnamed protein product, partial [Meganyctiphanes norvegica]